MRQLSKSTPNYQFLKDSSDVQSDYFNVFQSLSTESAFTALIVLRISLNNNSETLQEKFMLSESHYYKNYSSDIEPKNIEQLYLPTPIQVYCKFYSDETNQIQFTEYCAEVFRFIRIKAKVNNEDLAKSFDINEMMIEFSNIFGNKGGRSGSFFIYSHDKKYILKTISQIELKVLLGPFLKEYFNHLDTNNDSLLSRILGVYSFFIKNSYSVKMILMECIFLPDRVKAIYDLKGSKLDRQIEINHEFKPIKELDSDKVYKDLDFDFYQKKIHVSESSAKRLFKAVENDINLLEKFKIMDYSLLVAVKLEKEASKYFFESETQLEAGFSIGIIDFLQQYDRKKKFESISKKILTMRPRSEISSINPKDYKIRFFNFVNGIITTNGKNKDSYFDLY